MKIKHILLSSIIICTPLLAVDVTVVNKSCAVLEVSPLYEGSGDQWSQIQPSKAIKISTWGKPLLALRWRAKHVVRGGAVKTTPYAAVIYEKKYGQEPGILEGSISGNFIIYEDGEYYCNFGSAKGQSVSQADVDTNRLVIGSDGKLYFQSGR